MKFFKSSDRQYLMDIKRNNIDFYKYNYEFITKITEEKEYLAFVSERSNGSSFADMVLGVNSFLASYILGSDDYTKITYRALAYVLKSELDFNIELLAKERCFINIIQYRLGFLSNNCDMVLGDSGFELMLKNKIARSKDIVNELINILFFPNSDLTDLQAQTLREDFRNKALFISDILISELINMYHSKKLTIPISAPISSMISDNKLYAIVENRLEEVLKQELDKGVKKNKNADNKQITPLKYRNKITKSQFNLLFKGLVDLGCFVEENRQDFLSFMGLSLIKNPEIKPIEWKKTKALCTYFVDAFNALVLKNERIAWKPFEVLFSMKKLASIRYDYINLGKIPEGGKEINKLINKVLNK